MVIISHLLRILTHPPMHIQTVHVLLYRPKCDTGKHRQTCFAGHIISVVHPSIYLVYTCTVHTWLHTTLNKTSCVS